MHFSLRQLLAYIAYIAACKFNLREFVIYLSQELFMLAVGGLFFVGESSCGAASKLLHQTTWNIAMC